VVLLVIPVGMELGFQFKTGPKARDWRTGCQRKYTYFDLRYRERKMRLENIA